jgi:class 3 adenylate cyclase
MQLVVDRQPTSQALIRSVLFSDVVASTEMIDRRGDDAWLALVDRHARAVCAITRHHCGDVVSFLGDGFMLMFENPTDALQCAMRLRTASRVQDLVHIRIGLDHGQIFRYRDDWYVGRTIHVAARLADLCGDDEIIVSGRCMDHARRGMALPASETCRMAIRGLREPCDVYVLKAGEPA